MDEICICGHDADEHGGPTDGDAEGECYIDDCSCAMFVEDDDGDFELSEEA